MDKEEILNGNKLIAEFMGAKPIDNPTGYDVNDGKEWYQYNDLNYALLDGDLKFNSSYDWLMPVCKKVNSLGYDVDINSNLRRINIWRTDKGLIMDVPDYNYEFRGNKSNNSDLTDTECLFCAMVEFIEWHNEQKNND